METEGYLSSKYMNKVRFHYYYPINVDIDTNKEVDVYIDQIPEGKIPEGAIRIMILEEPKRSYLSTFAQEHPEAYTYLLTFFDDILATNPKAKLFLPMVAWIQNYHSKQKTFSVSTVVGGKSDSEMLGYSLRHQLWYNKNRIVIPKQFYLSGNARWCHKFIRWRKVNYINQLVLGVSKEPLFDSMFHIAIENCSIKNYFSEKLLDCFQSRTIPIYWGCINIEDFFDIDGIFVTHNLEEIINICNGLTPNIYDDLTSAMEANYQRSLSWLDHNEQIKIAILKILYEC
jgi:hypothetical protein